MSTVRQEVWDQRVAQAEILLIDKMTSGAIVVALQDETGVSERAAWRYLKAARERRETEIAESDADARETRDARRDRMRHTLALLFDRAFEEGDLMVALKACRQLCALDGLDAPKVVHAEVDIPRSRFADRSPADLRFFLRYGRLPTA